MRNNNIINHTTMTNKKKMSLFERLCSEQILHEAWLLVKAKNSMGGVDGESVQSFEKEQHKNLSLIRNELMMKKWIPQPYLVHEIAKKDKNEKRKLGLLSVKDKIIQRAIALLIEPFLEKLFVNNSYAYRPHKGHYKAVKRTQQEIVRTGYFWTLRLDIDDFFDTINHDLLFSFLPSVISDGEIIRLIKLCVQMGNVRKGIKWHDSTVGLPQGAILSPMMANLYLHPMDAFISLKGLPYVRYADDFVIFTETKDSAEALLVELTTYLNDVLHLKLNVPQIVEIEEGFEFLGIFFSKKGLSLSEKKMNELRHNIQQMQIHNGEFNAKSHNLWQGIKMYYASVLPQNVLFTLDKIAVDHFISQMKCLSKQEMPGKQSLQTCFRNFEFLSEEMQDRKNAIIIDLYNTLLESRHTTYEVEEDAILNKKLIESRKKEYRKKENAETELLVSTSGSYIGYSNHGIIIKKGTSVLLKHSNPYLKHITIIGKGITISTNAISYCVDNGIGIDLFDGGGKHEATILTPKFLEASYWKLQATLTEKKRMELARRLIIGKLKNQQNLLKYFFKYHKCSGDVSMERYEQTMNVFDSELAKLKNKTNDNAETISGIMGCESQAAIAYWAFIREMLQNDDVRFEKREHKGATDLFNYILNYGYAILYSRIWQALLAAKLNPYDSVVHMRQSGKPTFVFDCVELFRAQAVDRVVVSLIQKRQKLEIEGNQLSEETRRKVASAVLERMNRYEKYRGTDMTLTAVFRQQTKEIADYISTGKTFRPYIAKW